MTAAPTRSGFDAVAGRYDSDELGNPVLLHMRARAFGQLAHAFAVGSRVLELGSGTGTESSRLVTERQCHVALVDPSPSLLEVASRKVRAAGPGLFLGAHPLPARSLGELVERYGPGSFDGAFSSFGALNCEPSLVPVANALAALVRPGGQIVLSLINRWCPPETAWYALHGEWREATRRWGGPVLASAYPGGPKDVRTYYSSRREIERAFQERFVVEQAQALPLLFPPPYLDFLVARWGRFFEALRPLDLWASKQRVLRDLGDHVLVRLRRT